MTESQELTPNDGTNGEYFGYSVSLDGNDVFVEAGASSNRLRFTCLVSNVCSDQRCSSR